MLSDILDFSYLGVCIPSVFTPFSFLKLIYELGVWNFEVLPVKLSWLTLSIVGLDTTSVARILNDFECWDSLFPSSSIVFMVFLELLRASSAALRAPLTLVYLSDILSSALFDSCTVGNSSGCSCMMFFPLVKGIGRARFGDGYFGNCAAGRPDAPGSGDILLEGLGNSGLR